MYENTSKFSNTIVLHSPYHEKIFVFRRYLGTNLAHKLPANEKKCLKNVCCIFWETPGVSESKECIQY